MPNKVEKRTTESGFSLLQLMMVLAVAGVISAYAVISIRKSNELLLLQNSVRQLASNNEKARLDAVRRHDTSSVIFTTNKSYIVTMGFAGSDTRTYNLLGDIEIPAGSPLPSISFNWRGRTLACTNTVAFQIPGGSQSWVDVSDAGDVTVNGDVSVLPTVTYGTVSPPGLSPTTLVPGSGTHNNSLDCDATTTGAAGPPITGTGPGGCNLTVPSSLSIRKSGGSTGGIIVGSNNSATLTTSAPTNLGLSPTSQSVSANGSVTFSVSSLNNTRGTFAVNFSSSCTTVTTLVKVTN